MRRPELFYDWPSFVFAIRRSCLYILGAGASRPQIGGDMGERFLNELIAHTPNEVIELLLARLLTVPESIVTPQYAIFDRFPPSVLFNFNNDNLESENSGFNPSRR
jgi:hypothetical protein